MTDDYIRSTFRLHQLQIKFLDQPGRPTHISATEMQITQYKTGLLLLKHFGHLVLRIEFGTRSYTQPQVLEIAAFIHKYCADTLVEFNVHGDKVAAVVTQRVHFSSMRSFTIHIRDTDKFTVGYTFDRLTRFEVDATLPQLLPVEVLERNTHLESVSMPETRPRDVLNYLKHLRQPQRLQEVQMFFGVTNMYNEPAVTRLATGYKGLHTIKAIVNCGGGYEFAIAFEKAVKDVWGQAQVRYEDMPRDEFKNVVVYRRRGEIHSGCGHLS